MIWQRKNFIDKVLTYARTHALDHVESSKWLEEVLKAHVTKSDTVLNKINRRLSKSAAKVTGDDEIFSYLMQTTIWENKEGLNNKKLIKLLLDKMKEHGIRKLTHQMINLLNSQIIEEDLQKSLNVTTIANNIKKKL